jgi:DNA invertase Pin-like site-specific DNA recombinase
MDDLHPYRKEQPMPTAYGYGRASTERQVDTLKVQAEKITRYFEYSLNPKGYGFGKIFSDPATSGKTNIRQRPEGSLLNLALEPGDAVIIAKLDRGFRNARDGLETLEKWLERGVVVHILDINVDTSTPFGKMVFTMFAAFAEWERSRIRDRLMESIAYRRARGRPLCQNAPYPFVVRGPRNNKQFAYAPWKRQMGRYVVKMRERGHTFEQIYWALYYAGVKQTTGKRKGKEWSLGTLKNYFKEELQLRADLKAHGNVRGIPEEDETRS